VDRALELLHEAVRADALYDAAIIDSAMPDRDGFELAAEVEANPQLSGMRLMMLSSAAEAEGRKKAREHGIKAYLTKPVTRADLIDAMQALLGLRGPGEGYERRMITENSLAHERPRAAVLLAEDNKTNQLIALALLTKRGHDVDVVETGGEALEKVKSKHYDVVLMDIQMPEMDGLEATREIRKLEQFEKLPIVALTAHALAEEREQCEAAGMNHFVTKPFKPFELHDAVERWVRQPEPLASTGGVSEQSEHEDAPEAVPVDLEAFRSAMAEAGVEEVVPVTVSTYLDEAPGRFKAISDAVRAGDGQALDRAAHALRSASGALHAGSLASLLRQLEDAGREGAMARAQDLFSAVQQEYERVMEYLNRETE
jgi:CheY-like chemotaxis protein